MSDTIFSAPAIIKGAQWPVPFIPVRDQVNATAKRHPTFPAIESDAGKWSYEEFTRYSKTIAVWIEHHAPVSSIHDPLVAVVGNRSAALIAAVHAAWRVGAGYLPIASDYPIERIRYLLDDAKPVVILVDSETTPEPLLREILAQGNASTIAEAERLGAGYDVEKFEDAPLHPESLAYVIYTSGSTGKPKGAMISHSSICNFVAAHAHDISLTAADRHAWIGNVSFDASAADLWPSLSRGATLCIAPIGIGSSLRILLGWLRDTRINTVLIGTAFINMLFGRDDEWWSGIPLRVVLTGGDRLTRRPPKNLPFRFLNAYGPTECTVWVSWSEPTVIASDAEQQAPTIGIPIPNTFVVILDEDLHLCKVGEPGELCIGGAGVGKGYLRRPKMTAERFIPDYFSHQTGLGHLYRTGDQAILECEGQLRFLGRSDRQIAIHGFRVEAGEVEAAINALPEVKETVVKRHEFPHLGPKLLAFITWQVGQSGSVDELQRELKQRIPTYMVPNQFIVVDEMPYTPNGKIDQKKLNPPARNRAALAGAFSEPKTQTEVKVCQIFAKTLALDLVGAEDNFFDLGGDSLAAVEAMSAIEREFSIEIRGETLADNPTPRRVAVAIEEGDVVEPEVNWAEEVKADFKAWRARERSATPDCVFVTGATGFVGQAIVNQLLLENSERTVIALCRRLEGQNALQSLVGDRHERLTCLQGDLAAENLGLTDLDYQRVIDGCTQIIHAGALVNHIKPYSALKPTNVLGTDAVIRLAIAAGTPLLSISTMGAADDLCDLQLIKSNGYLASKWVAEMHLRRAHEQGLPVKVIRLGRVLPDADGQYVNQNDTLVIWLRAACAVGSMPDWIMSELATPVDVVARAVIASMASLGGSDDMIAYPPLAPVALRQLMEAASRLLSPLETLSLSQWLKRLDKSNDQNVRRAQLLLSLYSEASLLEDARDELDGTLNELRGVIDVGWKELSTTEMERMVRSILT
jgi:amino acid adenylation domain-containing protein/thioester reductase-like protein